MESTNLAFLRCTIQYLLSAHFRHTFLCHWTHSQCYVILTATNFQYFCHLKQKAHNHLAQSLILPSSAWGYLCFLQSFLQVVLYIQSLHHLPLVSLSCLVHMVKPEVESVCLSHPRLAAGTLHTWILSHTSITYISIYLSENVSTTCSCDKLWFYRPVLWYNKLSQYL